MTNKISGFKGFNRDFTCLSFKFEVGQSYKHDGEIALCNSGFHFCENALDVLRYYPPTSKFAKVEGEGKTVQATDDSKVCCSELTIGEEISLKVLIQEGVKFILSGVTVGEGCAATTGDRANAATTGYRANATTTGYGANAATTGYGANAATTGYGANAATTGEGANAATTGYGANAATTGNGANAATTGKNTTSAALGKNSQASVEGENSIAIVTGKDSRAKGKLGCWLVLVERNDMGKIIHINHKKVDDKKIKPNTFYKLKNNKFVTI